MRKVTLAIALAVLVMFAGCNKDKEAGTVLKASIEQHKSDSKTSLDPTDGTILWMAGDQIRVYNGTSSATFRLTNGAGNTNGTFTYNGVFEINDNTKAAYPETCVITDNSMTFTLPAEQNLAAPGSFANGANPMLGVNTGNGFTFVSVCGALGLSLTGDNVAITAIEIVSEGEMLNGTYTGYFDNSNVDLANGTSSVRLNCTTTLTADAKEFYIVLPVGVLANGFTLNIYNGDEEPIFTQTTTTDLTVELNKVKKMNTLNVEAATSGDEHEYVDLGLPSGLLWATCNVGAETPEDFGDYFAWGETEPKASYDGWSYHTNGEYGSELSLLLPEDDAATVNWGSSWRMPSKDEFTELYNNTNAIMTTKNGVNGWQFTSVTNGNSIFLPSAGRHFSEGVENVGVGYYWTRSLFTNDSYYAWLFYCSTGSYCTTDRLDRYYGFSVRPVCPAE